MSTHCLELLHQQIPENPGKKLWLADEGQQDILPALKPFQDEIVIVSNRFDVAFNSRQLGFKTLFNDWRFESIELMDAIFLRVCKEKQVTKHLIQKAFKQLNLGGKLILVGQKNEGIKSYEKIASLIFTGDEKGKHLQKDGDCYIACFTKETEKPQTPEYDYTQLSQIARWRDRILCSKHGVYGWDKIDKGSELLIEHLDQVLKKRTDSIESILDLGCGYGFLSIASAHIACSRRVATDNNAGALLCCEHNAKINNVNLEIIAGDCGDTVEGRFDLILCNPPFHKGFDTDGDLTSRFLKASRKKLKPKGIALFVVNSFIPLEKKLTQHFSSSKLIVNTGQFKVLALSA